MASLGNTNSNLKSFRAFDPIQIKGLFENLHLMSEDEKTQEACRYELYSCLGQKSFKHLLEPPIIRIKCHIFRAPNEFQRTPEVVHWLNDDENFDELHNISPHITETEIFRYAFDLANHEDDVVADALMCTLSSSSARGVSLIRALEGGASTLSRIRSLDEVLSRPREKLSNIEFMKSINNLICNHPICCEDGKLHKSVLALIEILNELKMSNPDKPLWLPDSEMIHFILAESLRCATFNGNKLKEKSGGLHKSFLSRRRDGLDEILCFASTADTNLLSGAPLLVTGTNSLAAAEPAEPEMTFIQDIDIVVVCNPLLDISAVVDGEVFDANNIREGDAILAGPEHMPIFKDLIDNYDVEYIAGGGGQNSARVAQWMLKDIKRRTAFFGAVGGGQAGDGDGHAKIMADRARQDGVNVQYMYTPHPTGTCAVLINNIGRDRSVIANLSAAEHFEVSHLQSGLPQDIINNASIFYITGYFLTVSVESILLIGEHSKDHGKTFCMNLSAPFLIEHFGDQLNNAMPYVDYLFGNENEARAFGESKGWGTDIPTIAMNMANLPKLSPVRKRTVVITQGAEETIVVHNGVLSRHNVIWLPRTEIVDTNGAGDAFVGGFLSRVVLNKSIEECVDAAHWAARVIIKQSGCKFPEKCDYVHNAL